MRRTTRVSGPSSQKTSGKRNQASLTKNLRRRRQNRFAQPVVESLEQRLLLSVYQNPLNPLDVNNDSLVTPGDVLVGLNRLNTVGPGELPIPPIEGQAPPPFFDTNCDNQITSGDLLRIINALNLDNLPPSITAILSNDTAAGGTTNDDGITSDALISVTATDTTGIVRLQASIDGRPFQDLTVPASGTFSFDPQLASDGDHTIQFQATDARQNDSGLVDLTLTLDTIAPAMPTEFTLTSESDTGISNSDGITNDNTPTVRVTAETGNLIRLFADVNEVAQADAAGTTELTSSELMDGDTFLFARVDDLAGNSSPASSFIPITVDTSGPMLSSDSDISSGATLTQTFASFGVVYDEPVTSQAFELANYQLRDVSQPGNPQIIEIDSLIRRDDASALFVLRDRLADAQFELDIAPQFTDLAGNLPANADPLAFAVADPPDIVEVSPAAGEAMVNVTRKIIIRFDHAVDPATIDGESFHVLANGTRIPGRIVVSSTERFATFLPQDPLPSSTQIRVFVDGDRIQGRDGILLDADGDGQPGGILTSEFRTLPLTRIKDTNVFGFVRNSFSGEPIQGVTLRLQGFPEVSAVTDADGRFELEDVPAPRFFVEIDGATATNPPAGAIFPTLGKPFSSVPGQNIQIEMDGQPFDIYLPPRAIGDIQTLSATEETDVVFGDAAKTQLQEMFPAVDPTMFDLLKVTFPPNSAIDDSGNAATQASIIPVPTDRLPAPLPPGVDPMLVISIQADGATSFDVPAAITVPNLEAIPPGEKTTIFSFDHELGEFVAIGTGTVSEDGASITSDPGVGISAPGWHYWRIVKRLRELQKEAKDQDLLIQLIETLESGVFSVGSLSNTFLAAYDAIPIIGDLPILDSALSFVNAVLGTSLDVSRNGELSSEGQAALGFYLTGTATGAIPVPAAKVTSLVADIGGLKLAADSLAQGLVDTQDDFEKLRELLQDRKDWPHTLPELTDRFVAITDQEVKLLEAAEELTNALNDGGVAPVSDPAILERIQAAIAKTAEVRDFFVADPDGSLEAAFAALRSKFEAFIDGLHLMLDDFYKDAAKRPFSIQLESGVIIRGETDDAGFVNAEVPPNEKVTLTVVDPIFGQIAVKEIFTGDAAVVSEGQMYLFPVTGPDTDNDGLLDQIEEVIGTDITKADTDGDGISDDAEVRQGLNPLDNRGFPTGVIASVPLRGDARNVTVEASIADPNQLTAYVATGQHGLAIVDASEFDNPIVQSQIQLSGNSQDVAVDPRLNIAAVASGRGGLHLVDVSDPVAPSLIQTLLTDMDAKQVEIADGIAYVGTGSQLSSYDLVSGVMLQALPLGGGDITGLAREGGYLYSMDSSLNLQVIDIGGGLAVVRDTLSLPDGGGQIFVGNGTAYAAAANTTLGGFATVDVSDPNDIALISGTSAPMESIPGTAIVTNGSGIGLLAGRARRVGGDPSSIEVLDVSDGTGDYNLQTRIDLAQPPKAVAIQGGIAFVASGVAGFQVVNYLAFDNLGQPPSVQISTDALDIDPSREGIQVVEGSIIPITATIQDDVQVRNVELLINDVPVINDVSFPFELAAQLPSLSDGSETVAVAVNATDTGGNAGQSPPLMLELRPDTVPPTIVFMDPSDGGLMLGGNANPVTIRFSEAIDRDTVNPMNIRLESETGQPIAPTDTQFRFNDRVLQLIYPSLELTNHRLIIEATEITDRAGNPLGSAQNITEFPISIVEWANLDGGLWHEPSNWVGGQLPGPGDIVSLDVPGNPTIVHQQGNTEILGLLSEEPLTLSGGTLTLSAQPSHAHNLSITGGHLVALTLLTLYDRSSWSGGTVGGTSGVVNEGTLNITGDTRRTLSTTITNLAMVSHSATARIDFNNATINNLGEGIYDLQAGVLDLLIGDSAFNNASTLRKTGAGTAALEVPFHNTGTLEILAGELTTTAGGANTNSTTSVSAGGTLRFGGGLFDLFDNVQFIGAGSVNVSAGSLVTAPDAQVTFQLTGTSLEIDGGILEGSGTITNEGNAVWTAGMITGSGLTNTGTLTIAGDTRRMLAGVLNNLGTVTHTATGRLDLRNAELNNLPGGTYDLQVGQIDFFDGVNALNNSGTFRKTSSSTATIDVLFNNTASTVDIQAGELVTSRGGANTDVTYLVSDAARLRFQGGDHTLDGSNTAAGNGSVTVNAGSLLTVPGALTSFNLGGTSFEIAGGSVGGDGTLTNEGTAIWTAGTITGSGGLTNLANLTIAGDTRRMLAGPLDNSGTVTHSATAQIDLNNGTVNNLNGGTYDLQAGTLAIFAGDNAVNNSGTFRKTSPATATIEVPLNNVGGTVEANSGTLTLVNGGSSMGGTIAVAGGATVDHLLGTLSLSEQATISGEGTFRLSGGKIVIPQQNTAELSLTGSGFDWNMGGIDALGELTNRNNLNISGSSVRNLSGVLNNLGTITHSATGRLNLQSAELNNLPTATYHLQAGQIDHFDGVNAFNNSGTFRKTNDSTATIDVPFNNTSSVVDIQAGELAASRGGTNTDVAYLVSDAARLRFLGGDHTLDGTNTAAGNGSITVNTGSLLTVAGAQANFDLSGTSFEIAGGTVGGDGTMTNEGTAVWSGGIISGTGGLTNSGNLTISGDTRPMLSGVLNNAGTVLHNHSGSIDVRDGTVNNLAGADYELRAGDFDLFSGVNAINNSGTFRKTGPSTASTDVVFNNTGGTVQVESGELRFMGGMIQTGGATDLNGGNIQVSGPLSLQAGTLNGSGVITGSLINGGTINPGGTNQAGTITITDSYTQTSAGVLNLELGGTAITEFDRLISNTANFNQSATFDGTLNISPIAGFLASADDSFEIITFDASAGDFATTNGQDLGGGLILQKQFDANRLTLTAMQTLRLAGRAIEASPGTPLLTNDDLAPVVAHAIGLWEAVGLSFAQTTSLAKLNFQIQDLPGSTLALVGGGTIIIDLNAAGRGWSADSTAPAADRVDLLSAISHELGHVLGLQHDEIDAQSVMNHELGTGVRRLPRHGDLDNLFADEQQLNGVLRRE